MAVARRRDEVRGVGRPRADLDVKTLAGCHTPVIEGEFIDKAFARLRELPSLDAPQLPDQSVLDQVIDATAQPQT